ncbi:hypothetical protein CERSUDRAFT_92493 [Gelatoporia subvermispora B]|uniref:Transcription factor CBF/NF-Y/archaeal histone domain-containing protein n=1 Tax=Ceriporiopsis subvermispora (strain B) TaxID=914234 RepID=M2RNJ3_CERS8|nr:hypothetical protein CERSUDRAFT_92493 [Gelatoporia subvermispora B]
MHTELYEEDISAPQSAGPDDVTMPVDTPNDALDNTPSEERPELGKDGEEFDNLPAKKAKGDTALATRQPGKSLLPYSRVQKVLKADEELPRIPKEVAHLISLATEEFTRRLAAATQRAAEREGRATIIHRDVAALVRRASEYLFLEEIIPWSAPQAPAQRKPKVTQPAKGSDGQGNSILDHFATKNAREDEAVDSEVGMNLVMNEDGTMSVNPS